MASPCLKKARGFTLIELMVTLAVLAIVVSYAVPSFTALMLEKRSVTAADELRATSWWPRPRVP